MRETKQNSNQKVADLIERMRFCDSEIAKVKSFLKQNRNQKQLFETYIQETGVSIPYSEWFDEHGLSFSADAVYGEIETRFDGGEIDTKEYFDVLDYNYCNAYGKYAVLNDLKTASFRKIATKYGVNNIQNKEDAIYLNAVGTWIKENGNRLSETLKSGSVRAKARIKELKQSFEKKPNLNFCCSDATGNDNEHLNSIGSWIKDKLADIDFTNPNSALRQGLNDAQTNIKDTKLADFDLTNPNSEFRQGLNRLQTQVGDKLADLDPTNPNSFGGKVWHKIKTIGASLVRGPMLLMIRFNFLNIASYFKLAKTRKPDGYEDLKFKWYKLGGDRTKFDKNVEIGYSKKPIFAKKIDTDFLHFDDSQISFDADGEKRVLKIPHTVVASVTPLAVLAGRIIQPSDPATKTVTSPLWGAAGAGLSVLLEVVNAIKIPIGGNEPDFTIDETETPPIDPNETGGGGDPSDEEGTLAGIKWYWWVGGVVALIGLSIGSYFLLRTKKSK